MPLMLNEVAVERISALNDAEPSASVLNIVFASDAEYIPYTAVTLASIVKNYTGTLPIRVFLLLDEMLLPEEVERIESLNSIGKFELVQIVVDAAKFRNIKTSDGISIATYYRLLLHNILPTDVEKVLYLDSDLIIQSSLDELFTFPMKGHIFAGVEDTISKTYNKKFGIQTDGRHINAGVMLINMNIMRSIGFDDILSLYLSSNRYRLMLGDQQIIAELFHGAITYLPLKWNVHGSMFNPNWATSHAGVENTMEQKQAASAIQSPAIIHYTLKRKPWISLEHPKSATWFSYLSLTPYQSLIPKPVSDSKSPTKKVTPKTQPLRSKPKFSLSRFFKVIVPGVALSVIQIRKTRLAVMDLERRVAAVKRVAQPATVTSSKEPPQYTQLGTSIDLKQLLLSLSRNTAPTFNAKEVLEKLPEFSHIMSNVSKKDVDGGYAENIKTITRTPNISFFNDRIPDAVIVLSQRKDQAMFWECLEAAFLYNRPLYFAEVALFGAFASYFDPDATLDERRALGFMLDDMGYYFDARQPSRIERTLNSPEWSLSAAERKRAAELIERICAEGITKYNKYNDTPGSYVLEPGAVLVIDQKKGDASIEFAGATDATFERMLQTAVADNSGKPIYFKRHPDSIQRNMNSYRNRGVKEVKVLPDNVSIGSIIDQCEAIYTVSSQVGLEGLMRRKRVVTFGVPFYAGWGLTDDRSIVPRRDQARTIEDLFHVACIDHSVYVDTTTGNLIEIEQAIEKILDMRAASAARALS
ncbi:MULTISPECIES: glycosyltransferase [unclassified Rhizobium]|uniref:glycosyltransferase n=1 Tax=unclassified Rhizobium TaxID=2613769 RepID=UPI001AE9BBE9|nr:MULTISPECIES: glycosyltransferase [unclassified Rhizobium]MBP2462074.1 capsular polysaccharide export protein [Rhizobium sp. PvP014]MBP2529470.1 capsular polysaccharide export protein [Rhizobium sp. PvP099]